VKLIKVMPDSKLKSIVILESDRRKRDFMRSIVSESGYVPFTFDEESVCLDNLLHLYPRMVILGNIPTGGIRRFINSVKTLSFSLPLLIISNDPDVAHFVALNNLENVMLTNSVSGADDLAGILRNMPESPTHKNTDLPLIIGSTPEMVRLKKMIPELSRSRETVLISGEAGTGKDLVARVIHFRSERRQNPLIKIDVDAIPFDKFESELFGYSNPGISKDVHREKNAFESAAGGTLVLDSVENLPYKFQAQLLSLVEKGSDKQNPDHNTALDVRIIVSTSIDLAQLVEQNRFRKDLYYRLNVIHLNLPSLYNRKEDIPLLFDYFVDKFCLEFGKSRHELSDSIKNRFLGYHWPGILREMEELIKRIVVMEYVDIPPESTGQEVPSLGASWLLTKNSDLDRLIDGTDLNRFIEELNNHSLKDICRDFVFRTEKAVMRKVLEHTSWNRKKAAVLLDISYKSLLNKIKAYDLARGGLA